MPRHDGRARDELRPVTIQRGFVRNSPGSVLYRSGATNVLVTAHVSDKGCLTRAGNQWVKADLPLNFQADDQPVVCVDWSQAAVVLERKIRALDPSPGASSAV